MGSRRCVLQTLLVPFPRVTDRVSHSPARKSVRLRTGKASSRNSGKGKDRGQGMPLVLV